MRLESMKRSVIAALVLLVPLTLLLGCSGADCPFTKPSCCDNALFGCGPFDLPQGCSCSDYFSRSFSGVPKTSASTRALSVRGLQDASWRLDLQRDGKGCAYLSSSVRNTITIRSLGRRVEVKALGYPKLRGLRTNRSLRARGMHRLIFPRCSITIDASMIQESENKGRVSGTAVIACQQEALSCTTRFTGVAQKLGE
jgi:hypothetical protein